MSSRGDVDCGDPRMVVGELSARRSGSLPRRPGLSRTRRPVWAAGRVPSARARFPGPCAAFLGGVAARAAWSATPPRRCRRLPSLRGPSRAPIPSSASDSPPHQPERHQGRPGSPAPRSRSRTRRAGGSLAHAIPARPVRPWLRAVAVDQLVGGDLDRERPASGEALTLAVDVKHVPLPGADDLAAGAQPS
jgi:hypothetical protein